MSTTEDHADTRTPERRIVEPRRTGINPSVSTAILLFSSVQEMGRQEEEYQCSSRGRT